MNRDDLIKKVQALRALSNNGASTLEEAATAARLAEQIIQKNALEEAELEAASGVSQEKVHEDGVVLTNWGKRQNVWQNILLTALCESYGCEGLLKHKDGHVGYYAVGRPSDISTMRYQFAWFSVEITRLAALLAPGNLQRGSGKQWYNSFYLGAVDAIIKSLEQTKREVQVTATSQVLAVIHKHEQEAANWMMVYHPEIRTVSRGSRLNQDAYRLGNQAGAGLNTKPGLNPGFRGLLNQ